MANFPSSIFSPRTKENKAGVTYDPSKSTVGFAEDIINLDDEVVALENELGINPSGAGANIQELLLTGQIKAPDLNGLKLTDDAGNLGLFIDDGGNVGINETSPIMKLHVTGSQGNIRFGDIGSYDVGFYLKQTTSNFRWAFRTDDSSEGLLFAKIGTAGSDAVFTVPNDDWTQAQMEIGDSVMLASGADSYFNGGNLGIGTSSPNSLIDLGFSTESLELVDAGSIGATQQDWVEVKVGGNIGYIRVFSSE